MLARTSIFDSAMFEDVSPHPLEWAERMVPAGRPCYRFFRAAFRRSYRFLDARAHAAAFDLLRCTYIAGREDPGIPSDASQELAQRSGGRLHLIPGAGHLEAIKVARREVIALALSTFAGDRDRLASHRDLPIQAVHSA